jgi:hypothetical protein
MSSEISQAQKDIYCMLSHGDSKIIELVEVREWSAG